ncbi:MAG: MBL fold metallo-hydrolase [Leptospiraceae bacterium]
MRNGKKWIIGALVILTTISGVLVYHYFNAKAVDNDWIPGAALVRDLDEVQELSILPLVNFHPARDRSDAGMPHLRAEVGVSYLIRTNRGTVLFDLGHNPAKENPSALVENMENLGISWESLDAIFISHTHFDHVGELDTRNSPMFDYLAQSQRSIPIFTPQALDLKPLDEFLSRSGAGALDVRFTPKAKRILPGMATTGGIPRQLFIGYIEEQALVINVQGKGLVIVVGCGHQTVSRLLDQVQRTFPQKIYGIVGDLHLPVPQGRMNPLGINAQRWLASGNGPLQPLSQEDVNNDLRLIRELSPALVALGTHDSSDEVIEQFARAFGKGYRYVRVGEWIDVE